MAQFETIKISHILEIDEAIFHISYFMLKFQYMTGYKYCH